MGVGQAVRSFERKCGMAIHNFSLALAATTILLFCGIARGQEVEPNSTASTATSLISGQSMSGSLFDQADVDFYRINLSSQQAMRVEFGTSARARFESSRMGMNVEVLNAAQTKIGGFTSYESSTLTSNVVSGPGDVYVKISSYGYNFESTLTYNLVVTTIGDATTISVEIEPNSTASTATLLEAGRSISGNLFDEADVDFYRINLSSQQTMRVEFGTSTRARFESSRMGMNVEVLNASQTKIGGFTSYESSTVTSDVVSGPGDVYIKVSSYGYNFESTLTYNLVVSKVGDATTISVEIEPNSTASTATPLTSGRSMAGSLFDQADVDFYRINLSSQQTMRVELGTSTRARFESSRMGLNVEVLNAAQTKIGGFTSYESSTVTTDVISGPGDVYVKISSYGYNFESTLTYNLSVTTVGDATTISVEIEPNATASTATPLVSGKTITGSLFDQADVDFYRLNLSSQQAMRVALSTSTRARFESSRMGLNVEVLNSSQTKIGGFTSYQSTAVTSDVVAGPGDVYIKVSGYGYNFESTLTYNLTVSSIGDVTTISVEIEPNSTASTATPLVSGRSMAGNLYDEADVDFYRINLSSQQTMSIALSTSTRARFESSRMGLMVEVLNSAQTKIGGFTSYESGTVTTDVVSGPGDVYVKISRYGYNFESTLTYDLVVTGERTPVSSAKADFVAFDSYMTLSSEEGSARFNDDPIAGDGLFFVMQYGNRSDVAVTNPVVINFSKDGSVISTGEFNTNPNETKEVIVTSTALFGRHNVEFVLDPYDVIEEESERNNSASLSYTGQHPLQITGSYFRSGNRASDTAISPVLEKGSTVYLWLSLKNKSVNRRSFEWGVYDENGALAAGPTEFSLNSKSGDQGFWVDFTPAFVGKGSWISLVTTDGMPALLDTLEYEVVEAPTSAPALSYFPASLDFGSVRRARESSLSFVVANSGASPLRVLNLVATSNAIGFSGDTSFDASSFTVEPGAEETVSVSLYPTTGGRIEEEIRFSTNDPDNSSVKIPVTAIVSTDSETGVLTLPIATLDFGEVDIGQTERLNIPVRNDGVADLTVFNVVTDNRLLRLAPTAFTVLPGATRTIVATLAPQPNKSLRGTITINSNDATAPSQTIDWEASLVENNYLSLASSFPASGDQRVATDTEFELIFDEALFQRGRYVDLDVAVFPPPVSGPLMDAFELRGRGNTVLFPVELADDTEYRLVVYGASSASGAELFDPIEIPFTTGSRFQASGSLSGAVDVGLLADEDYIVGNVSLFDGERALVAREPIGADGTYAVVNLPEGAYYVVADVRLSDGRDIEVAYDTDGDGTSDAVRVGSGQEKADVNLVYDDARSVVAPGRLDATKYTLDVGQAFGDQGQDELTIASGEEFHVSVYANNVDALTGYTVSALYDSTAVELLRATEDLLGEGTNLLKRTGGMPLFLGSDVLGDVVSVGGALLAPTADESASGSGLVATFRFAAKDGFEGETRIKLVEVVQKSFGAIDTSEVDVVSTIRVSALAQDTTEPDEESDLPEGLFTLDLDTEEGDQLKRLQSGVSSGDVYQVQIHGYDLPEVKGWGALINYDPSQVRAVANSFSPGSFLPGIVVLTADEEGVLTIGGSLLGTAPGASGDGFLGTVSFEILEGFAGSTDLYISETNLRLSEGGQSKTSVYHKVTLSAEIISAGITGDFNNSGSVDFEDFFMFADVFGSTNPAYDLDDSGRVDFGDFFVFADNFGRKDEVAKLVTLAEQMLGLPQQTVLAPNYPNPFNASTTLPYSVGIPGDIIIDIYDLSGQRIRRLVDAYHGVGQYTISWDGRDERSAMSSSGMYIVSIRGDRVLSTRKIMLMK